MTSCTVLLSLWLSLSLSVSSPVPQDSPECFCRTSARSLLDSLTDLMQKNQEGSVGSQFAGFNCSDLEVQMIPHTQTSTVCQPSSNSTDKPTCSRPSSSSFSTSECLRNISADLHYYHVILGSYKQHSPNISDLTPVMNHTKQLMQCLKRRYDPAEEAPPEGSIWTNSSFDNRKVLCKVLKGFVIRTVTINRVLGYISAGDHMK